MAREFQTGFDKNKLEVNEAIESASRESKPDNIDKIMMEIEETGFMKLEGEIFKVRNTGNGLEITKIEIPNGEMELKVGQPEIIKMAELMGKKIESADNTEIEKAAEDLIRDQENLIRETKEGILRLEKDLAGFEAARNIIGKEGNGLIDKAAGLIGKKELPEDVIIIEEGIKAQEGYIADMKEKLKKAEKKYGKMTADKQYIIRKMEYKKGVAA